MADEKIVALDIAEIAVVAGGNGFLDKGDHQFDPPPPPVFVDDPYDPVDP